VAALAVGEAAEAVVAAEAEAAVVGSVNPSLAGL
jgi:hypothetical protein